MDVIRRTQMIRHLLLLVVALGTTAGAQWLNYPTPGIPRLPDGKPDLSAPAPKTADGKPDLSGIWVSRRERVASDSLNHQRLNLGH